MQTKYYDFDSLAARARRGDCEARTLLQRQLVRQMVRIVRHALCNPATVDPLAPRIRAEARQLAEPEWQPGFDTPERLILLVAQRLCGVALTNFSRTPNDSHWAADTVCAT